MEQRIAVVTGAGGTIGSAISERLLADGHRVVLADVKPDAAEAVAARIDPTRGKTLVVTVDMTNEPSVRALIDGAVTWGGAVDVLVNNAGISEPSNTTWEMPLADWDRTIAIDLTGIFYACRAVLPGMIERRWGRIVNISSIAGKEGKNNPVAYSAAKAGVIGLTKAVAFEVAEYGVLVNVVTPGSIWSQNWATLAEDQLEVYRKRHPVGRFGRADEVAAMVAWLSSDACSFSTGAVFDISGGRASY
jgi:3-oxoacyl-[acyl-carrier protein] reductase